MAVATAICPEPESGAAAAGAAGAAGSGAVTKGNPRYKSGEFFGIPSVGAALKFAGVFETGLGDTGESLPLPAIIVWLPPTRDAAQFPVREAEKLEIPDKSGHLSVEPEGFCHFLSGLCLVLSQECPGFVRFCHPGKAEKQARRFWVRKFFRCHFVSFCVIFAGSATAPGNFRASQPHAGQSKLQVIEIW